MAGLLFLGALAMTGWYVHRYAVNALFDDQWSDVNVVGHLRSGSLSFGILWAQHNENRVLFPNLAVLALADTVHLNVVVESFINALLWWAAAALLVIAHHRRCPSLAWLWYVPVLMVFSSTIALVDTLFGFDFSWFLVIACLATAVYLLDRPDSTWLALATAVGVGIVGSYSSIQGLLIWPAGLALLLLRRRPRAEWGVWTGSGAVVVALYTVGFNRGAAGLGPSTPGSMLRYFFTSLANLVGTPFATPSSENSTIAGVGVVVFILAVAAVLHAMRHPTGASPLGLALITFGLLSLVTTTFGRAAGGLGNESRFDVFTVTVWFGIYLTFLQPAVVAGLRATPPALRRVAHRLIVPPPPATSGPTAWALMKPMFGPAALGLVGALIILQFALGWAPGLHTAQVWQSTTLDRADVEANIGQTPDDVVTSELGTYPVPFVRQMVGVAQHQRLSLFATPLAATDSRRGIFPALLIRVVRPMPGSQVSGVVTLDATLVDTRGVVRVVFDQGGPKPSDVIGLARRTPYGWVAFWPTTRVPNGTYHLRAVAVYASGRRIESAVVVVTVHHRSVADPGPLGGLDSG